MARSKASLKPKLPQPKLEPKSKYMTNKSSSPAKTGGTFLDMVKEAIIEEGDKSGLSRQAIKAFIIAKYDKAPSTANKFVNKAIQNGSADGIFTLPKGSSGKVKLRPISKMQVEVTQASNKNRSSGNHAQVEETDETEETDVEVNEAAAPPKKKPVKKANAGKTSSSKKAQASPNVRAGVKSAAAKAGTKTAAKKASSKAASKATSSKSKKK